LLRHVQLVRDALRSIEPSEPPHLARRAAEELIEQRYARCHDARIAAHYPSLFAVHSRSGLTLAAAGVRTAANGPLFLEAYLPEPVEVLVSRHFGSTIGRREIVEIGSLASRSRTASIRLFGSLAEQLQNDGYSHAVATATSGLRELLTALGFETIDLAHADATRLPDGGRSWGRYYGTEPRVMAGDIARNAARLALLKASRPTSQDEP
jgi:hypothetical protein